MTDKKCPSYKAYHKHRLFRVLEVNGPCQSEQVDEVVVEVRLWGPSFLKRPAQPVETVGYKSTVCIVSIDLLTTTRGGGEEGRSPEIGKQIYVSRDDDRSTDPHKTPAPSLLIVTSLAICVCAAHLQSIATN